MPSSITPETVFLVSGGARGITAQCVIELARHFRNRYILLGRTDLRDEPAWAANAETDDALKKAMIADMQARGEKPTPALVGKAVSGVRAQREIRATIDAVKAAGGEAVYVSADITNSAALRTALDHVRSFGTVTGILHGAGNLADKLIENKTEADFENVYTAKVDGLENLLAVIDPQQLRTLVLFSSVAGFYGNIGQADYAIANEILNKTAHRFKRQYPQCQVVSINWGPWDGGMVTPQLRAYFDQLNIRVIPVEVGTRLLVEELMMGADSPTQIVVGSPIHPPQTPPDDTLNMYRLHRQIRLNDSPFLGDHVVNGQAVLPMVAAMSWMSSACEQIHRGYRYFSFENYRVLKGIVFDDSLASEYLLELKEVSKTPEQILIDAVVRSQSVDGKPRFHYSAQIGLVAKVPPMPTLNATTDFGAQVDIPGTDLYHNGTLFHGYAFQGVERVLRMSEDGLIMRCVLPQIDLDYQGQFPIQAFNYFMADIGLQSIGIYARHHFDMGSLPLRATRGEHFANLAFGQEFFVTMQVRSRTETNVTADITLHDDQQNVYMLIRELEVTMSKRLNEMFLNNRLPEAH